MKNQKLRPYIGITGIENEGHIIYTLRTLIECRPGHSEHLLQVGVMTSREALYKQPTKLLGVFPDPNDISDIFGTISTHSDIVKNCLHYTDPDFKTTFRDLVLALNHAGPYVHVLQLNMTWPNPAMISSALKSSGRQVEVILQIDRAAFEEARNDPEEIVRSLREYIDVGGHCVIDRVLLDRSGGRGHPLDAVGLLPHLRVISKEFPNLGLGVAGGLGPDTMHLLGPLLEEFPNISFDAQGKLCKGENAMNPIDPYLAEKYIEQACITLR